MLNICSWTRDPVAVTCRQLKYYLEIVPHTSTQKNWFLQGITTHLSDYTASTKECFSKMATVPSFALQIVGEREHNQCTSPKKEHDQCIVMQHPIFL